MKNVLKLWSKEFYKEMAIPIVIEVAKPYAKKYWTTGRWVVLGGTSARVGDK